MDSMPKTPERLQTESDLETGEAWAAGLRKMELVHEREGLLGEVYLDLHPRRVPPFCVMWTCSVVLEMSTRL